MDCDTGRYWHCTKITLGIYRCCFVCILLITCVSFGCSHVPDTKFLSYAVIPDQEMLSIQDEYFECDDEEGGDVQEDPDLISDMVGEDQLLSEFVGDPDAPFSLQEECHSEELVGIVWVSVPEPELIEDPLIEENCADSAYAWCNPDYETEYLAYLEEQKQLSAQPVIFPNFVIPVEGGLVLRGMQAAKKGRRGHYGLDIIPSSNERRGAPIKAVEDGVVVRSGQGRRYGYYTVIYHQNGLFSLYSHVLKDKLKAVGQKVQRGETIALMGKTGNARGYHLHFELIDLREHWTFDTSIDEFIAALCHCSINKVQLNELNKLLFSKATKQDPLRTIPGLAWARWVKGQLVAVPLEAEQIQPQVAKKK